MAICAMTVEAHAAPSTVSFVHHAARRGACGGRAAVGASPSHQGHVLEWGDGWRCHGRGGGDAVYMHASRCLAGRERAHWCGVWGGVRVRGLSLAWLSSILIAREANRGYEICVGAASHTAGSAGLSSIDLECERVNSTPWAPLEAGASSHAGARPGRLSPSRTSIQAGVCGAGVCGRVCCPHAALHASRVQARPSCSAPRVLRHPRKICAFSEGRLGPSLRGSLRMSRHPHRTAGTRAHAGGGWCLHAPKRAGREPSIQIYACRLFPRA